MGKYMTALVISILLFSACEQDFLDKTPDEDLSIEDVFSERNFAEQFLTNIYSDLPVENDMRNDAGRNPFTGASDEMEMTWYDVYSNSMNSGAWNSSDERGMWHPNWVGIRKANIFIENIDQVPLSERLTKEDRDHWKGEAIFLRAFYHFMQMRLYGPVPIMDYVVSMDDDYTQFRRDPIDKCVEFVVKDCDDAAALLPLKLENPSTGAGRATKAAALALKSRVLLYMASPLWNALKADESADNGLRNLKDHEQQYLFPQTPHAERWAIAASAAKQCIDEVEGAGYGLYRTADGDPAASFQNLFLDKYNKEVLFALNAWQSQNFERQVTPRGMGGYTGAAPTQELVDAFEMQATGMSPINGYKADGTPDINPESGYAESGFKSTKHPKNYYLENTSNMYVGRDPRFYASINFSGAYWRIRRIEFWKSGLDGVGSGNTDYTKTGYLIKKYAGPSVRIASGTWDTKTWIFFRLAEIYLNYAEALNESQGPVSDVYHYVNAVRKRAGMPDLPLGLPKEQMREKIRNERRIELAFETHRYFDVRRWRIAENVLKGEIHGLNIYEGQSLTGPLFFQRKVVESRVFVSPKHYFWPFPVTEINNNPNLIQNPGW